MRKYLCFCLAALLLLGMTACGSTATQTSTPTDNPATTAQPVESSAPATDTDLEYEPLPASDGDLEIEPLPASDSDLNAGPVRIVLSVRDYGDVTLELYPDKAPITVENFVNLARAGFYDGLTFHRIMDGFMIQGGDPNGNGTGGSGATIKGEFSANGVENDLKHVKGTISMARNSVNMDSASSQFFITVVDYPSLNGQYAAFGRVVEGMDVVTKIAANAKPIDNNGTIPADQQPVIEHMTVLN